jgi:anaerobic magnesium-protoporphyrin IX monomethyl ester cyclase
MRLPEEARPLLAMGAGMTVGSGRKPVVLYNPRGESHILPLALVHLGSMLSDRKLTIVDGRIDDDPERRVAELAGEAACLGVTVLTGAPILDALRVTRAARAARPDLPVLWGGWHPSLLPEQCLASGLVDACVSGQGERTLVEALEAVEGGASFEGVRGLTWRRGREIVRNPPRPFQDVNRFPRADFSLLDLDRYFAFRGVRRLDYCSSQGCPFQCAFCADPMVYRQRWSGLAASRVVGELREHVERYRLDEVFFNDDNFFTDLRRTEAVCRGLLEVGVRVRWFGTGRADLLRRLTDEQLVLLRASGCYKINVGAESGSPELLKTIRKGTLVEEVLETAEKLHRFGIGARFSFIAGFPQEPASSLQDTYRTVKALRDIDGSFETPIYFYAPYPGTELAARMPAMGFEAPRRLEDWERVDLDHSIGPWISAPVRKWVPRYNFYLRHAYQRAPRLGGALLHRAARLRVKAGFYGLDVERRAVDMVRRFRTGTVRQQPEIAEN